jgi:hypothetical protein
MQNKRLSKRGGASAQLVVFVPVIVAIALVAFSLDFFVYAVRANPAINLSILVALVIGVLLVLRSARVLDRERMVFDQGMAALRISSRADLASLPSSLTARLFVRLAKLGIADGTMLPEGSIDAELKVVRLEIEQRHQPLHYIVGLMVALGLFGTFIGLLETLVSAAEVLNVVGNAKDGGAADMMAVFSTMVAALKAPLVSMGTAFSASMFGLVGSIVIGLMMTLLSRLSDRMLEQARAGLYSISDASRATLKPIASVTEEFLARFLTDLTERNRHAADMLGQIIDASAKAYPAMREVSASVHLLAERMDRQSGALQALPGSIDRLAQLPESIALTNAHLARIHASLSQQEAGIAALTARAQAESASRISSDGELRSLLELQLGSLREIQAGQGSSIDSARQVADTLARLGELASLRVTEALAEMRSIRDPLGKALQALSSGVQKSGESGAALVSFMPAGIARLESSLNRIGERLTREEEALRTQTELLRADLENEDRRVAGLRLLGDAVLSSAGSVDSVREELSLMLKSHRQVSTQLTDVLKAVEASLGKMQSVMDDQQLALRIMQGMQAENPGERGVR